MSIFVVMAAICTTIKTNNGGEGPNGTNQRAFFDMKVSFLLHVLICLHRGSGV